MIWKAVLDDGSVIPEYNQDGTYNKYQEIDKSKLASFSVFLNGNTYTVDLSDKAKKFIYVKRTMQKPGRKPVDLYILGWQKGKEQSILYITEQGEAILSGAWGKGPYCKPKFEFE